MLIRLPLVLFILGLSLWLHGEEEEEEGEEDGPR